MRLCHCGGTHLEDVSQALQRGFREGHIYGFQQLAEQWDAVAVDERADVVDIATGGHVGDGLGCRLLDVKCLGHRQHVDEGRDQVGVNDGLDLLLRCVWRGWKRACEREHRAGGVQVMAAWRVATLAPAMRIVRVHQLPTSLPSVILAMAEQVSFLMLSSLSVVSSFSRHGSALQSMMTCVCLALPFKMLPTECSAGVNTSSAGCLRVQ